MASIFESVDHNRSFPAKIFVTQINQCDFHWHYDYEMILILKGSVNVYCGSQPTTLNTGDMYFFNSRVVHGIQRTGTDNLCLCLQFSPQTISNNLEDQQFYCHFYLNSTVDAYPPRKPFSYFARQLAQIAISSNQETDTAALRIHAQLLNFLADLVDFVQHDIRRMPLSQARDPISEIYGKILQYVDQNMHAENLSQKLCKHLGMSEKSLYRYLKNTLGLTFKELLDISRVEKACTMIQETQKPLSIIWQTCGFSSEVSFYRIFKKQLGCTPNEYRKGHTAKRSVSEGNYLDFDLNESRRLLLRFIEPAGAPKGDC